MVVVVMEGQGRARGESEAGLSEGGRQAQQEERAADGNDNNDESAERTTAFRHSRRDAHSAPDSSSSREVRASGERYFFGLQWMVRGHVAEALVFVLGNDTLDDLARASYGSWTTGFRV